MLLKPVTLAAAGLAAAANAFLLPPEVTEASSDIVNALPFEIPHIAEVKTIELDCPGCSHTLKNSHLDLVFEIQHGEQADRLAVNGYELYPNSDPFTTTLIAPHIADSPSSGEDGANEPATREVAELGFSMQLHAAARDQESNMELVAIDLQIIEVGTTFVDGIPNVHIKLIKAPGGALMIGSVEMTASQTMVQSTPMDSQDECTSLVCKWASIMKGQLGHLKKPVKSCHGMKKAHGMGARPQHNHHHHKGGKGSHHVHAHTRHHSWARLFKRIASHILLPVLVGIIAGVSVSLVGMLVGTLIVALWRKVVRGGSTRRHRHAGHAHRKAAQHEFAYAEEKCGLMEHQDTPPAYEEERENVDA